MAKRIATKAERQAGKEDTKPPHRLTGNQLYKLRTVHGRKKIFECPVTLEEEAIRYFEWCDRNPWERSELVKYKGFSDEVTVPVGRPYSIEGLTCYLGVSASYFRSAKANIQKKLDEGRATEVEVELLETMEYLTQIIRTQNIEGATVGVFSPHIVTRVYQLAENVNTNQSGGVTIVTRDKETQDDLNALANML